MKTKIIAIVFGFASPLLAQDALPPEVVLIAERHKLALEKLNSQYIRELESAKLAALKRGDKRQAESIALLIAKNGGIVAGPIKSDKDLDAHIRGTQWVKKGTNRVITFRTDGLIEKSWGVKNPKWSIRDGKILFESSTFTFNEDYTILEGKGEEKEGTWLKRE